MRKKLRRWTIAISFLATATVTIVSWIVGGVLVAPCPSPVGSPPADLPIEAVTFPSESGSDIHAWYAPGAVMQGIIVLLHPIRGSRLTMVKRARIFWRAGYSVLLIDFQGHGESTGGSITLGHLESRDAAAAVQFAKERHPNEPIAVVGSSMGGASALLASPLPIDALILESVYATISEAVHNRVAAQLGASLSTVPSQLLLVQLKPRLGISPADLRPIDHIADVGCPVLVASGSEDRHTPLDETKRLFAAAQEPKQLWIIDGAAHVDLCSFAPVEYETRCLAFLEAHMRRSRH